MRHDLLALFERTILRRKTVFLDSKRWKMGGANFTSSRTQKTSWNKTIVGLWKRAWNNEAARNVEQSPITDGGLAIVYDLCDDTNENPEERYPIVQDLSLVRAAQMASLRLLHTLPSTNKAEYAIKMYGSMERSFNHILRERTCHVPMH